MTEKEGSGSGRCIIVLMGGRSGGHQAAVLGAVGLSCWELNRCSDDQLLGVPPRPPTHRDMWSL